MTQTSITAGLSFEDLMPQSPKGMTNSAYVQQVLAAVRELARSMTAGEHPREEWSFSLDYSCGGEARAFWPDDPECIASIERSLRRYPGQKLRVEIVPMTEISRRVREFEAEIGYQQLSEPEPVPASHAIAPPPVIIPTIPMTLTHQGMILNGSKTTTLRADRFKPGEYAMVGTGGTSCGSLRVTAVDERRVRWDQLTPAQQHKLAQTEGYTDAETFAKAARSLRLSKFLSGAKAFWLHHIEPIQEVTNNMTDETSTDTAAVAEAPQPEPTAAPVPKPKPKRQSKAQREEQRRAEEQAALERHEQQLAAALAEHEANVLQLWEARDQLNCPYPEPKFEQFKAGFEKKLDDYGTLDLEVEIIAIDWESAAASAQNYRQMAEDNHADGDDIDAYNLWQLAAYIERYTVGSGAPCSVTITTRDGTSATCTIDELCRRIADAAVETHTAFGLANREYTAQVLKIEVPRHEDQSGYVDQLINLILAVKVMPADVQATPLLHSAFQQNEQSGGWRAAPPDCSKFKRCKDVGYQIALEILNDAGDPTWRLLETDKPLILAEVLPDDNKATSEPVAYLIIGVKALPFYFYDHYYPHTYKLRFLPRKVEAAAAPAEPVTTPIDEFLARQDADGSSLIDDDESDDEATEGAE